MSFTSMHNDYLDPDRHNFQIEPPEAYHAVLEFFSAENEEEAKRNCYRYTDCGAYLEFDENGIVLGSIIEGCDFGTNEYNLNYADDFTSKEIQECIDNIEIEASALWDWANRPCDKNGKFRKNGAHTQSEIGIEPPQF